MAKYTFDRKKFLDLLRVGIVTDELDCVKHMQFIIDLATIFTHHFGGEVTVRYNHEDKGDFIIDIDIDDLLPESQENIYDKFDILG